MNDDLLQSITNDEWVSIKNKSEFIKSLQQVAHSTMVKDQRMNVRISKKDLLQLKALAMEEGMPYQTLVTSIIHKYINGNLKEVRI